MNAPNTLQRHKLSVRDFHRMGEAGILREDSRVELIDGDLIDMAPMGSQHASVVNSLVVLLARMIDDQIAHVSCQTPIALPPDSEPQPDIALLLPRADRYRNDLPTAADVLLVIEVADTSIAYDRGAKLPLYARHQIDEVWIIDLAQRAIEVHQRPLAGSYTVTLRPLPGQRLAPMRLPNVSLSLETILV